MGAKLSLLLGSVARACQSSNMVVLDVHNLGSGLALASDGCHRLLYSTGHPEISTYQFEAPERRKMLQGRRMI